MPENYIEEKYLPHPYWGWILLIVFSASLLGFGMWLMMNVEDVPREWNFGTYPDTPAESVYATDEPPPDIKIKRVIPELPDADPNARIRTQGPAAGMQSRWHPEHELQRK